MRIHRIKLRNYRGVTDAEVDFPADGVTIIEGDNEAGKTSLSEAIDLLLEHRDDSGKKAVKAVKPAGKDVGAEVEIEISTGPYRFRYRKRWHRQKETVLEILEPKQSQLTGREAHDKVRAMLDETLDGTLWEALRLRQGTQLEQASFAGGSLGRALDLAAGGDSAGDREDDLWARITSEKERYWTATGQPKVERSAAADRVAKSADLVADLTSTMVSLDLDTEQVARLTRNAEILAVKQATHDEVLKELTAQCEAITTHRNEVERLARLRDTAKANHGQAFEIAKTRTELLDRTASAGKTVSDLAAKIELVQPERAQVETRRSETQKLFDDAKAGVRDTEIAERRAVGDRDFRRQQIELAQLSERHSRVIDAIDRRSKAEVALESSRIDDVLLKRIEDAHLELAKAEASATSAAIAVDAEALIDLDLQIDGTTVALEAGSHHRLQVPGTIHVAIPGTITMVIKAGAEAQVLADRQIEAELDFRLLCKEAGVDDLAGARQAIASRQNAQRVLVDVVTSIDQDLRDLTPEALAQKVQRLTVRVKTYETDRSPEPPIPHDLDSAQALADDCECALEERRDELARLEKDLTKALVAVQKMDLSDATSKALLEQARAALDQAKESLDTARQKLDDDEVTTQVNNAETDLATCAAELTAAEATLAAEDPDTVQELLLNARGVKKRLADEVHETDVTVRDLRTRLAVKGDEGLANKLDDAKTDLVRQTIELERLEARAVAAKVLYDTFAKRRAEAHHRYVAPFREKIEQFGRLVFGPDFEVELDDELRIAQRVLNGTTLDFADLSTGAREQLGMISRLACASIVAADGGAPVIFDDALGWSDPRKLDRMGAVISMAGRSCQVIVLTCTPGRYESVGSATVIQLPS